MAGFNTLSVTVFLLFLAVLYCSAQPPFKKFEYKYSFKGPHLIQKDETVPFWQYGGSALASEDKVRVTPSLRSRRGYIWSKMETSFDWWEIEVIFKVTGRGRVGADGLGIWFTQTRGEEGGVYGSSDKWNGMGLFFDSFDNDNQRNNPYILVVTNDGTKQYDHHNDGLMQQLGGCMRDFRNKPFPVRAKVEYYKNVLTVYFHQGLSANDHDYELCMRAENVYLPQKGYFGVSAATGGLADDHDVMKFLTHSLATPESKIDKDGFITDEEAKKFKDEFDDFQGKLQQQKEDFRQQHPDKIRDDYDDTDSFFEDDFTRELKLILTTQNGVMQQIKMLGSKLDEIVGRQERTLSLMSSVQAASAASVGGGGAPPVQHTGGAGSVMQRHEVDSLLNTQRELQQSVRDIRNVVGDVQNKAGLIYNRQPTNQGAQMNQGNPLADHEMLDKINSIQDSVLKLTHRPETQQAICPPAPDMPSCLTPTLFFVFAFIQIFVIFLYTVYRSKQEAAAKKFY
ncbi:protein ERGIC-53-like [Strongylocentrotus purpuratus]|uniref:L-type lectin-like domain-containing protein n=1 Tax=Strongylocentrotus purpuratus TaxID=7668 RepID=A0A7M7MYD1_STRPU|nr:protein ERGIC-53-like [Strongylocentrotus purpuratus]